MQSTCHIEAPVEKVFDYFLHPTKLADLMPPVQIRELKETDGGTGTYTSYRTRVAGIPFDNFSVYTDVVPNRHITEKSSSSIVGTWDYDFEPEGNGTKLTMRHHSRSVWGLPPLSNLGDVVSSRLNERFMQRAKARIESAA